jgi:hypothetical protein
MTAKTRKEIQQLIKAVRQDYGAFIDDAELSLLSRWASNDDCSAADALRDIIGRAEAAQRCPVPDNEIKLFIIHVIKEHRSAQDIGKLAPAIVEGRSKVAKTLRKRRHEFMRQVRQNRVSPNEFEETQRRLAQIEGDLVEAQRAGPPSFRSDKNGSRARTEFMQGVSKLVNDITGFWMDNEVAAVASVVLGRVIDAEQVRNANRETTRAGRCPKTPYRRIHKKSKR